MSNDKSQQNNDYNKDINLLTPDLKESTKPTVRVDDVTKTPKQDLLHENDDVVKTKRSESWLHKMLHHDEADEVKPSASQKKEKQVEFKKGSKDSFNLNIKEKSKQYTPSTKQKKTVTISQAVSKSDAKPDSSTSSVGNQSKHIDSKTNKTTKPTTPKQVSPAQTQEPKKHDSTNIPSIKDFIDSDKKTDTKEKSSLDVNLIPAELRSAESSVKAIKKISIAGGISILLVVIVFLGLSFVGSANQQKIINLQQEVKLYEEGVQASQDTIEQLTIFTEQTQKVGELLQGQERWSRLFDMLEQDTIDDVYYKSVNIASDDKVVLQVVARSYYDLARQYKIFDNNPNIKDLTMNSASLDISLWESYVNLSKQNLAQSDDDATSTQEFVFDKDKLKSLLTVESAISFDFVINATSTTLDTYE